MSYAIIRGENNRRHEVEFGDDTIKVEINSTASVVEIIVEADHDNLPERRRRFAIVNIPKGLFSEAMGNLAKSGPLRLEENAPELQK